MSNKKAEVLQALEDGEMDVLSGAEDLRDLGVPDEEIATAVGEHNWLWVKAVWRKIGKTGNTSTDAPCNTDLWSGSRR